MRLAALKPLIGINIVTLQRNQSVTGVRRADFGLNRIAGVILALVEFDHQPGFFINRSRQRRRPDGILNLSDDFSLVFQINDKFTAFRRVKFQLITFCRQIKRLLSYFFFLRNGFIGIGAVWHFNQIGNIFLFLQPPDYIFALYLLQIIIHGNQFYAARRLAGNILQSTVGLIADNIIAGRHQRHDIGTDTTPRTGFHTVDMNGQPVCPSLITAQIYIQNRPAGRICFDRRQRSFLRLQFRCIFFLRQIRKHITGIFFKIKT